MNDMPTRHVRGQLRPVSTERLCLVPVLPSRETAASVLFDGVTDIGSDSACEIHVPVPGIDACHCSVQVADGRAVLTAHSRMTWINDRPVREAVLTPGQRLAVGPVEFLIESRTVQDAPDPIEQLDRLQHVVAAEVNRQPSRTTVSETAPGTVSSLSSTAGVSPVTTTPSSSSAVAESTATARDLERRRKLLEELQISLNEQTASTLKTLQCNETAQRQNREELNRLLKELSEGQTLLRNERDELNRQRSEVERRLSQLKSDEQDLSRRRDELQQAIQQMETARGEQHDREHLLQQQCADIQQDEAEYSDRELELLRLQQMGEERHHAVAATADERATELTNEREAWRKQREYLEGSLQQLRDDLSRKEEEYEHLRQSRDEHQSDIDGREAALHQQREDIARQTDELEQQRLAAQSQAAEIRDRELALEGQQQEIERQAEELAQAKAAHEEKEHAAAEETERWQTQRAELESSLQQLREVLSQKEEELQQLQQVRDEQQGDIAEREAAIDRQLESIARRCEELEQQEAEFQARSADLQDREHAWEDRQQEIGRQSEELAQVTAAHEAAGHPSADESEKLNARRHRLDEEQTQLEAERARLEEQQDELQCESECLAVERNKISEERDEIRAEREALGQERASLEQERHAIDELRQDVEQQQQSWEVRQEEMRGHESRISEELLGIEQRQQELETREASVGQREEQLDAQADETGRQPGDDLAHEREELDAVRQSLLEDRTQLEEESSDLQEQQRRLEADQSEILRARQDIERVRENLASARQELRDDQMRLESAWSELERDREDTANQRFHSDSVPDGAADRYEVSSAGYDTDSSEIEEEIVDDREVNETRQDDVTGLRSKLADMFGMSSRELEAHARQQAGPTQAPEIQEIASDAPNGHPVQEAPQPVGQGRSDQRDDTNQRDKQASEQASHRPVPAAAQTNAVAAGADEQDSIAAYMERLLARNSGGKQGTQVYQPAAKPTRKQSEPTATSPGQFDDHQSATDDAPLSATPIERKRANPEMERAHIDAFRELANRSARSAVARHNSTSLRGRFAALGILSVVLFVMTVMLLTARFWVGVSYASWGFFAAIAMCASIYQLIKTFSHIEADRLLHGEASHEDGQDAIQMVIRFMAGVAERFSRKPVKTSEMSDVEATTSGTIANDDDLPSDEDNLDDTDVDAESTQTALS